MKSSLEFTSIYLYLGVVDFRKQSRGLAIVVDSVLKKSLYTDGAIFVFVSKDRRKIRSLYWDETGFAIWGKILEKERFPLPKIRDGSIEIDAKKFGLLLSGIDIFKIKPHKKLKYTRY